MLGCQSSRVNKLNPISSNYYFPFKYILTFLQPVEQSNQLGLVHLAVVDPVNLHRSQFLLQYIGIGVGHTSNIQGTLSASK